MTSSSKSNLEGQYFHTETKWKIELDGAGDAIHYLEVKLLNPEFSQPTTNLSFDLPKSGIYTDFSTEVDGYLLAHGKGYIEAKKRYSLPLAQSMTTPASSTMIKITFKHKRASFQLGDLSLIIWLFEFRMRGPIILEVTLPRLGGVQRLMTWIQRLIEAERHLYKIHEVDYPPVSVRARNVDYDEGKLSYLFEDGVIAPGFAFSRYSNITVYSAILGIAGLLYMLIQLLVAIAT